MPRSNYDDDEYGSRSGGRRNRSPDYYSGAGGGPATGFGDPGRPFRDDEPFQREEMTLMPPAHGYNRANSVPPGNALAYRDGSASPYERSRGGHGRSRSRSNYDDDDDDRRDRRRGSESPMSRARHAVEDNFTNSSTGIGAGILGAVVGGFVANKASDAAFAKDRKGGGRQRRHSDEHAGVKAVSTLLGAVAGGLGANAFAHHVEGEREKRREREQPYRGRYVFHVGKRRGGQMVKGG